MFFRKFRVALTPRNWLLKTKLRDGVIIYGKNRAGYGGRGIYVYRDSIEPEFEQLERFVDPGGIFVDVGANTGIYTLKAAKILGDSGVVVSLEPFPEILATLDQSIQANGFTNVRLRNLCAGARTEVATFWMNKGRPHSFGLVKHDQSARSMSTLSVKLDDLFDWEGLTGLQYLKIDAEGAEDQILSGAQRLLSQYRPIVQMEITLTDAEISMPDYGAFQAPNSPNKVWIPSESPKIVVPKQLGWNEL